MAPVITTLMPEKLKGLNVDDRNLCTLEATVVTGLEDVRILITIWFCHCRSLAKYKFLNTHLDIFMWIIQYRNFFCRYYIDFYVLTSHESTAEVLKVMMLLLYYLTLLCVANHTSSSVCLIWFLCLYNVSNNITCTSIRC